MNTGDRRRLIKQLSLDGQDRHALLTNARCLTEGVDVPSLDGVAFIDPRSSQVDIIQAVGRAIRKSENKEVGTIVLPVLIPTDSNAEEALEDTAFKPVWAILNALKSHDDDFAVELNNLRTELGRTGKPGDLPNRLVEDLPVDIDSLLPGFSYQLSIAILEHSTSNWEWWIGLLNRYLQEFNSARITAKEKYMGASLGYWISEQREQNKLGRLTTERFDILNCLPGWSWDPLEDDWASQFDLLKTYLISTNDIYPENPRGSDNAGLGKWIIRQRQRFSNGWMPHTQIEQLESLPDWKWDPLNENWNSTFEILRRFAEREGHARPAAKQIEGEERLGLWVNRQRKRYKTNRVLPHQRTLLEALPGWSWDPQTDNWTDFYSACQRLESTNPMIKRGTMPKELLEWMKDQRERFQNGQLSDERIHLLEQLNDWNWKPRTDLWQIIFDSYADWAKSNNPNSVPPDVMFAGASGLSWTDNQRTRYRTGKLTENQIRLLESIPGWKWERMKLRWHSNFETLQRLIGDSNLEDTKLSAALEEWVRTQRRRQRNRTISQHEIEKLESIDGWSWTPRTISIPHSSDNQAISTAWMNNYQTLKRFSETGGSSSPSVSVEFEGLKIGKWVSHQRDYFKKGKLSPNKIELLESLSGWIWSIR
jgi:hypothetical protein